MFKGCLVALITPFRDGRIDTPALEALVEDVIAGGVDGLVPCGTTGESPTLSDEERGEVIATVVRVTKKRVPVIAGTGTNDTARTIRDSVAALRRGADAVMLVNPYYNRPTQAGLYQHFSRCAREIAAPILLYNIPGRTAVELSVDTIARLRAEHRNIAAVKHATGSVDSASELALASDITILSGDDTMTLPLMIIGARGVVSVLANLVPTDVKALTSAALEERWADARAAHRRTFRLARDLLTLETNPIPIKTALALRGKLAEEFRLPMCPLSSANRTRLISALHAYFEGDPNHDH